MKKSAYYLFFVIALVLQLQGISQTGTLASPFTSLNQAYKASAAGIYYFNFSGTIFSSYVDENKFVFLAIDFGNRQVNLPTVTSLTTSTRGILTAVVLSKMTDAVQVRIASSTGNIDVSTFNTAIISKVIDNQTIQRGNNMPTYNDNLIKKNWVGTGSDRFTGDANCGTGLGVTLDANIFHPCGVPGGFHWIPSINSQTEI